MSDTPRVALVHDWLTGMRGGENVLSAIADAFPKAPIFTLFHFPGSVSAELEAHSITTSYLQRAPFVRTGYRRYLPFFPSAIEDLDLQHFDLIISSSHCVAKGVISSPNALHLCYCHTPMRYAWDQERVYFPRRRGPLARLRALALSRLRIWDVASTPRVDHFWSNSEFVRARIRRFYDREAEVLHPPVDTDFFSPEPDAVSERSVSEYCLMVSALAPYKRVDLAIEACQQINLPLIIVGTGPEQRELERRARPTTRFAGRVGRSELRSLYRNALCFLQPGLEDFGIAAAESLACGTPVVALGAGGVLDIVENGRHGVLYEPSAAADDSQHIAAIKSAIDKTRDLRFNSENLALRAHSFSSSKFIERLRTSIARQKSGVGPSRSTPS